MRIVALKALRDFWRLYPDAEQPLKSWADEVRKAAWRQPADIKITFRNVSILQNSRAVFNIRGNHYRLIVSVAYGFEAVYVKFLGAHAQYDAVDALTVEWE